MSGRACIATGSPVQPATSGRQATRCLVLLLALAPVVAHAQPRLTAAQRALARNAAIGDMVGTRPVPEIIKNILANPRIDPNIAYMLWKAASVPTKDWTMGQLKTIVAVVPLLTYHGLSTISLKVLYKFMGFNTKNLFQPLKIELPWQVRSILFDPHLGASPTSISSAKCQRPLNELTVGTYIACFIPKKR